jgi:tetratricopeptide (TPR) repeat protein
MNPNNRPRKQQKGTPGQQTRWWVGLAAGLILACAIGGVDARVSAGVDTNRPAAPEWLAGYQIRYPVFVPEAASLTAPNSVMVRLPTGGWLLPDARDVAVQGRDGRLIASAVLSHDPRGFTLVQFKRREHDEWYWIYGVHPNPPPAIDAGLLRQIQAADAVARKALTEKMEMQKLSAQAAEALRAVRDRVDQATATSNAAAREIASWEPLLAERQAKVDAAVAQVPPADAALTAATAAATGARTIAQERLARVQKLDGEVRAASNTWGMARSAYLVASNALAAAQAAVKKATPDKIGAARQAVQTATEAYRTSEAQIQTTGKELTQRTVQWREAEGAALPERMEATRLETLMETARQDRAQKAAQLQKAQASVGEARTARDRAMSLRDSSAAILTEAAPQLPDLKEAFEIRHTTAEQAAVAAQAAVAQHTRLVADADPRVLREGLTVEFRDWAGDELTDWATVYEGLNRSESVIGNGIVPAILQNFNPVRRSEPRNFAASYRGYLKITEPGVYRFLINGDDAAFLFIDNYKVYSRKGSHAPLVGRIPMYGVGEEIELEAGLHPIEVHQVVGNTPGAEGRCALLWLKPGASGWSLVPPPAFSQSLIGTPAGVEARDGKPVAIIGWGIDDTLVSDGVFLSLVRFQAVGSYPDGARLSWNFGDGLSGVGETPAHVYFQTGDREVSLASHPTLPPFKRRIHIWSAPMPTSPFSLAAVVDVFRGWNPDRLSRAQLDSMFAVLTLCGQTNRWDLQERLCERLLAQKDLDSQYRMAVQVARMDARAAGGRAAEALNGYRAATNEVNRLRIPRMRLMMEGARIQQVYLRDFEAAGRLYDAILDEGRRIRHPVVRAAATARGDLYWDAGDWAQASAAYRAAADLGSDAVADLDPTGADQDATRGALLRVAEQALKSGDMRQSQRLLKRIERAFPEQKLEGFYRFLRAETDRKLGAYDDAVRNYEAVLKLPAWSSYRAATLAGIADAYARAEEWNQALEWIKSLETGFPEFYAQNGYAATATRWAAKGVATTNSLATRLMDFDFDHTFPRVNENTPDDVMPLLGRENPGVLLVAIEKARTQGLRYSLNLPKLTAGGRIWVEFWYTAEGTLAPPFDDPTVTIEVKGDSDEISRNREGLDQTYGDWRKYAHWFVAPHSDSAIVVLRLGALTRGLYQFDDVRVRSVSDAEAERLRQFIEGTDPQ